MFRGICAASLSLTSSVSCWANELLFRKDSITVFGGVCTTGNMGETFNPSPIMTVLTSLLVRIVASSSSSPGTSCWVAR
jgi:hypothetical protein